MQKTIERKIHVYLIGRINRDNQPLLDKIAGKLTEDIEIFMPHKHNPFDKHPWMPPHAALRDWAEILFSDIGVVVVPFGRDSAWEIGCYSGLRKTVIVYIDCLKDWLSAPQQYRNNEDWMVKINPTRYVTPDTEVADILTKDRFCMGRIILLDGTTTLAGIIKENTLISEGNTDTRKKVLIVDDDLEFCDSLTRLVNSGERIIFAHSFEEAVLAYKLHKDSISFIIQDETLDDRDDALKAAGRFDDLSSRVLATFFRFHSFSDQLLLMGETNGIKGRFQEFDCYFEKSRQILKLLEKINEVASNVR